MAGERHAVCESALGASAHERLEPPRVFFTAAKKRFVLNGSERTDGSTAAFFQTQHASFSGWCGGRTTVGGGNGTQVNTPACAHERQNSCTATSYRLPFQASAHIMDLDFKIFDSERLITGVEKRPALYIWLISIWVRALMVPMHLGLM